MTLAQNMARIFMIAGCEHEWRVCAQLAACGKNKRTTGAIPVRESVCVCRRILSARSGGGAATKSGSEIGRGRVKEQRFMTVGTSAGTVPSPPL